MLLDEKQQGERGKRGKGAGIRDALIGALYVGAGAETWVGVAHGAAWERRAA